MAASVRRASSGAPTPAAGSRRSRRRRLAAEYVDPAAGRETLEGFFTRWRAQATQAPSTLAKYDTTRRLHVEPRLGRYPLGRITRSDVRTLVESVASPHQATEALKLVRMLLNRALDAELIGRNPAARVEAPRIGRAQVRILSPAELEAVAAELPERWRAFVLLGAYASLRWSELVAVRRDDLDLQARTVRVDEKVVEVGGRFEWGLPKTPESAGRGPPGSRRAPAR